MEDKLITIITKHIEGGEAFSSLKNALEEITWDKLGERPMGLPYSFYELFYHITYAQRDIVNFCMASNYKTPSWPKDYWPNSEKPDSKKDWENLKNEYFEDRNKLIDFVRKDETRLSDNVKNDEDKILFRELLLVIEHSAYHTGQLYILLRLLNLHD